MKKLLLSVFILNAAILFCNADSERVNRWQQMLPQATGTEKMDLLIELALHFLGKDPTLAIEYGNQALSIARKEELKKKQVDILSIITVAYEYRGNYHKCIALYEEALHLARQLNSSEIEANVLINLSTVHQNLGRHEISLKYNLQALEIFEKMANKTGVAKTLNNIGNVYLYLEQIDEALEYYLRSVELKKETGNPSDLASGYHNLALAYQQKQFYDIALDYFDQALSLLEAEGDGYSLSICYMNLSNLHYLLQDYEIALQNGQRALQLSRMIENEDGICINLNNIANILIKQKQFDSVPEYLGQSHQLAMKNNNRDLIASNYKSYSEYYENIDQLGLALDFFRKYQALNDSINNEMNKLIIAELGIQYETTRREKEIELLKKEAAHQNQIRNYLIYALILGIALIIFLLNLYYDKIRDGKIRQEIQKKLRESEFLYRTLTDNLHSAVFTFDADGKFVYVNKASCRISGYSEEELLSRRFVDIVHPDFRDYVAERGFSRLEKEIPSTNFEFKIITKNGQEKWVETSSVGIKIGEIKLVLGTAIDVTERHQALIKLSDSEAHLRALFAGMEDVIFVIDQEGRFLNVAPTNPDLLYKPADEVVGWKLEDIFTPEMAKFFLEKITLCLSAQEMVSFDYQLKIRGADSWFGARITPLGSGTVLFIGRDITDEKVSFQKLAESEEKYRNLVESIEEGMVIVDRDLNFSYVNNAAVKIFGYSRQEFLSMNVKQIMPSENMELVGKQHEKLMRGEKVFYENWNVRKDGQHRLMKVSASPLCKDDRIVSTISIFSDITEIRLSEEKIKASLREKEALLQEIYHRVKNNMQIISSMLRLQSQYITRENALEVFKNSQNRVKSMSLVHEKLYRSEDLSRIEMKEYLASLLQQLIVSYENKARKIKFRVDCENIFFNINTAIPCGLIMNELITNSLKHAFQDRKEGLIQIKLRKIMDDLFQLEIGNDGDEFPTDLDLKNAGFFGLQLVDILRNQLHADFHLEQGEGVNFVFVFRELI